MVKKTYIRKNIEDVEKAVRKLAEAILKGEIEDTAIQVAYNTKAEEFEVRAVHPFYIRNFYENEIIVAKYDLTYEDVNDYADLPTAVDCITSDIIKQIPEDLI